MHFVIEMMRDHFDNKPGKLGGQKVRNFVLAVLCFAAHSACQSTQIKAERIFENGKFYTVTGMHAKEDLAECVAVAEGKIIYVGDRAGGEDYVDGNTQRINLQGARVLPGFTDSHMHLLNLGMRKLQLDVTHTRSAEEVVNLVGERAAILPEGEWILGRGWDQNDWPISEFPNATMLQEVSAKHPVFLRRIDGHAAWLNLLALEKCGITHATPEPLGGRILRDAKGTPSGILIDRAMDLALEKIPEISFAKKREAIHLAVKECLQNGITNLHDAGVNETTIQLYQDMSRAGELPLSIYVMLDGDDEQLLQKYFARGPLISLDGAGLTIRAIKLYADGALGSRGAALFEDYADEPGHRGALITHEEELFNLSQKALKAHFQVCTHAIGDRANHTVLNAYERAITNFAKENLVRKRDPRFRIEHAQILAAQDIPRFQSLRVIPSMQTTHCTSDMPWVIARIGEQRAMSGAYVWRKLRELNVPIANGSDAPVEAVNPLWGIYAAITRQDHAGNPAAGWYAEQCLTREEAIASYTRWPAYAAFEEFMRGTLEPGKVADMVVLSQDILDIPPIDILQTQVVMTIVRGEILYQKNSLP